MRSGAGVGGRGWCTPASGMLSSQGFVEGFFQELERLHKLIEIIKGRHIVRSIDRPPLGDIETYYPIASFPENNTGPNLLPFNGVFSFYVYLKSLSPNNLNFFLL